MVGAEVTSDLFRDLGLAVGSLCHRVVVGRDPRTSGPMLSEALASGLLASGAQVYDVGMVSTPTLALAARRYDCGAMITASHNPPEYNGLKLWNPNGMSFDARQREEVEARLGKGRPKGVPWDSVGERWAHPGAVEEHMDFILARVGTSEAKVVVDCGCGATSNITPYLLEAMGCRVLALNAHPDGTFPARDPEPVEENLGLLCRTVRATGADLGIAHDGDGDRMVAVDEAGNYVGGDRLLALLALREAKRCIVVPVDSSMVLEDSLPGVEVVRTRVGDVYVAEEVARRNADFGGEPSGTWIFPRYSLCPDGVYAAAHLVELVAEDKLSHLLANIPQYPLKRGNVPFAPARREQILRALARALPSLDPEAITTVDGWRLTFPGGWVVVRPSGTEPKVRIAAEAREEREAAALFDRAKGLVEGVVG